MKLLLLSERFTTPAFCNGQAKFAPALGDTARSANRDKGPRTQRLRFARGDAELARPKPLHEELAEQPQRSPSFPIECGALSARCGNCAPAVRRGAGLPRNASSQNFSAMLARSIIPLSVSSTGMGSATPAEMRARFHSKLIAALLAPALLASGATQGLLLMRCGPTVSMSCCCPGQAPPPASTTVANDAGQSCAKIAVPSVPAPSAKRVDPIGSEPILVAVLGSFMSTRLAVEHVGLIPRLDLRPGRSLVLANCSFLI